MQQSTLVHNKYSVKYYPDKVLKYEQSGNYFYFHTSETIMEVRVISDKIVRFRYAPDGKFKRDFSYAIQPELRESLTSMNLHEEEDNYVITTSQLHVLIAKEDMRLTIKDMQGQIINEDETGFHWQYYILKGGKIVYCSKKIQEEECFFGMGDKAM